MLGVMAASLPIFTKWWTNPAGLVTLSWMNGSESSESARIEELTRQVETLRQQLEKAQAENERLRKELEDALRSLKRQAAPFSRGKRKKKDRNRPGRKSGAAYGKQASRPVPERVNEEIAVPLPTESKCCGAPTI